jgi:hypothetical protein
MTIIKLKGGLGNQLFQYAYGRLIAARRGEELKLDKDILGAKKDTYRAYGLDNFNIQAELATPEEIKAAKYPLGNFSRIWRLIKAKVFRIYHIGYECRMLKPYSKYLDGYFQSYKYLDLQRAQLLKEISLKEDLSRKYGALISEMAASGSVAVHIRRGDYVSDAKTKKAHFVCDLAYYERAMEMMKKKINESRENISEENILVPIFYIFSDDISWAKENLKVSEKLVFVSNPELKDYEELMLMSGCQNNIIANSSFSFWSAWLNQNPNKIVIGPKKWNNKYPAAYRDLMPKEWIKI